MGMMRGHKGELGEDMPDIMGEEGAEEYWNGSDGCSACGLDGQIPCLVLSLSWH